MNMNPGDFDKKIEILLKSTIRKNAISKEEYKCIRKPYAAFKRTTGKEKLQAGTEMAVVEARFIVRASPVKLTNKMVIRYKESLWDIQYVNDYGDDGQYVEIWARLEKA